MSASRLNTRLANRRGADELDHVMRGASSSPVAPSLLSAKLELERRFSEYDLRDKLGRRPTADDLYSMNVLHGSETDEGEVEVLTSAKASEIVGGLVGRPGSRNKQIQMLAAIEDDSDDMVIEEVEMFSMDDDPFVDDRLTRIGQKRPVLQQRMAKRPSISEVESRMADMRSTARAICPGVRPKIRHYEDLSHHTL